MKGAHPFQNPRSNPTFHSPAQHPSVSLLLPSMSANDGGEGGIRTHGPVARTAVFETARFGHSRTSPRSHPPTPGPSRRTLFPWLVGPANRELTGNDSAD